MFARQLCRRIPGVPGRRPVALRPTLSGGLPLSGCDSFRSYGGILQGDCQEKRFKLVKSSGHSECRCQLRRRVDGDASRN